MKWPSLPFTSKKQLAEVQPVNKEGKNWVALCFNLLAWEKWEKCKWSFTNSNAEPMITHNKIGDGGEVLYVLQHLKTLTLEFLAYKHEKI